MTDAAFARTEGMTSSILARTEPSPPAAPSLAVRASITWDEIPADLCGGWPAGGALLFVWPRLHGDRRWPDWTWRPGDPEDPVRPWWRPADAWVAARLLSPIHAHLLAFLERHAGAASSDRPGWREAVAPLAEGATPAERPRTLRFGRPAAAALHARSGERGLWVWLARGQREALLGTLSAMPGLWAFEREPMDWRQGRVAFPAPRPPRPFAR